MWRRQGAHEDEEPDILRHTGAPHFRLRDQRGGGAARRRALRPHVPVAQGPRHRHLAVEEPPARDARPGSLSAPALGGVVQPVVRGQVLRPEGWAGGRRCLERAGHFMCGGASDTHSDPSHTAAVAGVCDEEVGAQEEGGKGGRAALEARQSGLGGGVDLKKSGGLRDGGLA